MPSSRLRSLLVRVVLSLTGLAGAGSSHGAIYTGNWDPLYGAPFAGLGWSANALFDIPDACLAQVRGSCSISFVSAQVSFYDATDLAQTPLETFQIASLPSTGSATVLAGRIVSVESNGFFDPFVPSASGAASAIDGAGNYSFNLILNANREGQLWYAPPEGVGACFSASGSGEACGQSNIAAVGIFAPVPEPAGFVLMGVGLFAVAAAVRRRGRGGAPKSTR